MTWWKSGGSFWYELLPSILVGGLVVEYPQEEPLADGWDVLSGRWGDHDVAGLAGVSRRALSVPQLRGGYGFAMGTFRYAWPLVASVRYDNRLARPVGKWIHAAAHTLRLLYPDQVPPDAAVVVVCVPQTIKPRIDRGRLVAGSTVIDWSMPGDAD